MSAGLQVCLSDAPLVRQRCSLSPSALHAPPLLSPASAPLLSHAPSFAGMDTLAASRLQLLSSGLWFLAKHWCSRSSAAAATRAAPPALGSHPASCLLPLTADLAALVSAGLRLPLAQCFQLVREGVMPRLAVPLLQQPSAGGGGGGGGGVPLLAFVRQFLHAPWALAPPQLLGQHAGVIVPSLFAAKEGSGASLEHLGFLLRRGPALTGAACLKFGLLWSLVMARMYSSARYSCVIQSETMVEGGG